MLAKIETESSPPPFPFLCSSGICTLTSLKGSWKIPVPLRVASVRKITSLSRERGEQSVHLNFEGLPRKTT